ncbi:MAG TPA: NAD(P)-dependent oxidoreductase [Chloroflexota bacterium]|nr:NAD(P)-dependent oxidoreductase [Chloroflexota bacterium]
MKAGVIGVGAMGSMFVERFHKAGLETVVYDVSPAAVERCVAMGSTAAPSPAAVAEVADVVDVMVLNEQQVLDAVLGEGGVLQGMTAGKLLLLHSTVHPRVTRQVAEAAGPRGVRVADGCVTGRPWVVQAGQAVGIVGCDDDLFPRVEAHMRHFCKDVFHMGGIGAGNAAKAVKNFITAAERLVIWEGLRVAEAEGVSYTKLLNLMRAAVHESVVDKWEETFDPSGVSPKPVGAYVLFEKDVPLAEELAADHNLDVPLLHELVAAGKRLDNKHHS